MDLTKKCVRFALASGYGCHARVGIMCASPLNTCEYDHGPQPDELREKLTRLNNLIKNCKLVETPEIKTCATKEGMMGYQACDICAKNITNDEQFYLCRECWDKGNTVLRFE